MKTLTHQIDSQHWEHLREKSRSDKSKSEDKSDNKKTDNNSKSDDKGKNPQSGNNSKNNPKNKNKSGKPMLSTGASTSSSSPNPLADKLGKDGKLTQQE